MMQKNKLDHILLLRAMGIILVVLSHATRSSFMVNPHLYNPGIIPLWEITIRQYLYSFHMPLFFWISGFVLYYSAIENRKQTTVLDQIIIKVKRLILPMYATSFLILLPTIFFFGHMNGSIIFQMKLFMAGIDNDHLWFLETLFIIFLIIIPLYGTNKNDNIFFYVFIFVSWILLYTYQSELPTCIKPAVKYFPFFMVGCLSRKYEHYLDRANLFFFFLFFALHICLYLSGERIPVNVPRYIHWYAMSFFGVFFMYFLSKISIKHVKQRKKLWKMINQIDGTAYSIYLFHVSFLYLILFLDFQFAINIALVRIIAVFVTGCFIPIIMHHLFARNKILSQAFSIPHLTV